MEFKPGQILKARIPFRWDKASKVHILHVLPSVYEHEKGLIIYKVYGTHKQWWHTFMNTGMDMDHYIKLAK